ncbi:MAG TPA: DUF4350 domain-containing protein [Caldilineaceae bacterium]|nr:DUF4350 domain-containing protein [Caldilineaceae bacterium]
MPRRLFSGQTVLAALLVLLVLGFAVLQGQPEPSRPYDPASADAWGLRALVIWLEEMGYSVDDRIRPAFTLEAGTDLVFVFPTANLTGTALSTGDALQLRQWVADGGSLVLIAPGYSRWLGSVFGVGQESAGGLAGGIEQAQPLLPERPARWAGLAPFSRLVIEENQEIVPVWAGAGNRDGSQVYVAVQQHGAGVIWYLHPDYDLTNATLRDENVAALVPAILRTVPAGGRIRLHTYVTGEAEYTGYRSLREWLYTTPLGQALLFGAGAVLLYLALQGRRLGPALALPSGQRRREAAEFVMALAGLQRRARQRNAVARHHKSRLKQAVGRSLHLSSELPDDEFLDRLRPMEPGLSPEAIEALAALLRDYDRPLDEGRLVRLVQATDEYLSAHLRSLPTDHRRIR